MNKPLQPLWLKAALLGSTWASIEIILGSFLHNLRVPFVGAMLASIGAALLVAGFRIWKERGLLWRAGLICALMKSVSPSAVVLGPMIGIASEGFLLEGLLYLFGTSVSALIIASGIIVTLPLLQSIISLLFLYGFDVAKLYVEVYNIAAKNLRIESLAAFDLILIVAAVHVVLGLAAGFLGLAIAKRVSSINALQQDATVQQQTRHWEIDSAGTHSLLLLAAHPLLLVPGLMLIRAASLWTAAGFVCAYGAAVITRYPAIQRRFSRVKLWVEFGVVTALAGLLLKGIGAHTPGWQWEGLLLGLQMTVRAAFVILVFSAIGFELRNPRVLRWMMERGLGNLTAAMETAFETLPTMIAAMGIEKQFLRHPIESLARMLKTAIAQMTVRAGSQNRVHEVILLSGNKGEGKTTFVLSLTAELRKRNIRIGGIAAIGTWNEGVRQSFDVVDLQTDQHRPLCSRLWSTGVEQIGAFQFGAEGLEFGRSAIRAAIAAKCDVVIIDEIGPLELQGGGWSKELQLLVSSDTPIVILTSRHETELQVMTLVEGRTTTSLGLAGAVVETVAVMIEKKLGR